jgi:hypothetical protein
MFNDLRLVTTPRPTLLFYCQHSLGIGHLTRSFALATALKAYFHVVFLNGGRLPPGLPVPGGIEIIDLPALGMDDGHTVVSRDAKHDVAQAQVARRAMIEAAVRVHQPAVVLVELFPFGRKKFAAEILAMIRAARRQPVPARVACSLRGPISSITTTARAGSPTATSTWFWCTPTRRSRGSKRAFIHADPCAYRCATPVTWCRRAPQRLKSRAANTFWYRPAAASSAMRCFARRWQRGC